MMQIHRPPPKTVLSETAEEQLQSEIRYLRRQVEQLNKTIVARNLEIAALRKAEPSPLGLGWLLATEKLAPVMVKAWTRDRREPAWSTKLIAKLDGEPIPRVWFKPAGSRNRQSRSNTPEILQRIPIALCLNTWIIGRIPTPFHLILIPRIDARLENGELLSIGFHHPIPVAILHKPHKRSCGQSRRQRIVVGVSHREHVTRLLVSFSAAHSFHRT
jgi:hypothetical protein